MKRFAAKSATLGVLGTGMLVSGFICAGVFAPVANADGCGGWNGWIMNGGSCDFGYFPDGSHTHCDSFSFWGIGGSNCFFVPAPPPPPPPVDP